MWVVALVCNGQQSHHEDSSTLRPECRAPSPTGGVRGRRESRKARWSSMWKRDGIGVAAAAVGPALAEVRTEAEAEAEGAATEADEETETERVVGTVDGEEDEEAETL